jgi:hypothetical protein
MCKMCVAEGRMTQEEYESLTASNAPTIIELDSDSGVAEILAKIMGSSKEEPEDPEAEAEGQVEKILTTLASFINDRLPVTPSSAVERLGAAKELAGIAMFRLEPSILATMLTLAGMALRDANKIIDWAAAGADRDAKAEETSARAGGPYL